MKQVNFWVLMMLLGVSSLSFSQDRPKIEWKEKIHDFKEVDVNGKTVSATFFFKVTGKSALVIHKVTATCGCTTAEWPKQPIIPDEWGKIIVFYNPKGQHGHFDKHVFVETNAIQDVSLVRVKGIVK